MARAPIGEMFIELGLDTTKFGKGASSTRSAIRFFGSEVRALDNIMKSSGKNLDLLGQKHKALGNQIEAQKQRIKQLQEAYNDPKKSQARKDAIAAQIGNETAKLKAMEGQLKLVNAEMDKLQKPRTIGLRLEEAGAKIESFGNRIKEVSSKVSSIGDGLTKGITAPIVAGAGIAIKAAVDYESAFAGVKKTVDGTAQDFEKLSSGIREMAKTMPASAVEIANVAEAAGQLGIKKEDILSFTKTMIDLGESTNLSATDAATAIAKMGNITGLTADEYSRFGSSIVALGNNFATTEADIVNMSTRMASAGTLAGLTNQEILALATAMSSVGIEAEAGGTAMSQTLATIGKAVDEAGDDVQRFAEVAGMSAEEFSAKWKEKPIEAIQEFIKGLGKLDEKGESATQVLEDLGLSGIRQSNMLKSLGLASGELTKAVETSNKAWEKNTALSEEAAQRYKTTESKLKTLKNKVNDLAIEFGGPLVDALRDGLDAAEPFIKDLAEMAKNFSSLSREQQQNIVKWGGLIAAAGPFLSFAGRVGGGISTLISGFGKLTGGIGKGIGSFKNLGKAAEVASGASGMAGAASSAAELGSAVGALSNPIGLLVGTTALLAGGVALLAAEKDRARQRAEEFGTALDNTQRKELQDFKVKVDEAKSAIVDFTSKSVDVDRVKKAFKSLHDEIEQSSKNANQRLEELGEKWGLSDEQIQKGKAKNQLMVENTDSMVNQINEIYERHKGDASSFSQEEKDIILNNQQEITRAKLKLMELSNEQQTAVMKALNGNIQQLNETQLKETAKSLKKAMDEENRIFKESKNELKDLYESGTLDKEEYNAKMRRLESEHQATMENLGTKYVEAMKRMDKLAKERTGQNWNYWEEAKKVLEEYGMSFDDIGKKAQEAAKAGGHSTGMLAKYTADMTKETKEANDAWSALVGTLDEKTGRFEIKSNVKEAINEATQSQESWEQLMFIAKNADLETNARVTIAEALAESGRWNSMTPEEKKLVLDGKQGLQAIFDSKKHLEIWNSLPAEVKELLLKNEDVVNKAGTAKEALENYNKLTPQQKELLAKDEQLRGVIASSTDSLIGWDILTVGPKVIDGDNTGVMGAFALSDETLQAWAGTTVPSKDITAEDKTSEGVEKAKATTGVLAGMNIVPPIPLFSIDQTQQGVEQAKGAIATVKQETPAAVKAKDETAGPTKTAKNNIDKVKQDGPSQLKATDGVSGVAKSAKDALDLLPRHILVTIEAQRVGNFSRNEKGTNYHPGGLAMVNDQKGPLYKELIQLPSGDSFIPEGRNVVLDLPRGSKVLPANRTRDLMRAKGIPGYKDGIGFTDNSFIFREFKTSKPQQKDDGVLQVLKQILIELKINRKPTESNQVGGAVYMDGEKVGRVIQERIDRYSQMQKRMRGEV